MHGFHSMPQLGIQRVSLKAYRRWDSTYDKMMSIALIDKPLTPFDVGHRDSATGGPIIWLHGQGIIFFCQFWKLGFCLVSECQIFAHKGQLEGDCRSSPHIRDVSVCTLKCRRRQFH